MTRFGRGLLAAAAAGLFVAAPFAGSAASAATCGPEDLTNQAVWTEYADPAVWQQCAEQYGAPVPGGDAGGAQPSSACNPTDPTTWMQCAGDYGFAPPGGDGGGDSACNPTDPNTWTQCPGEYGVPGAPGGDTGGGEGTCDPANPDTWGWCGEQYGAPGCSGGTCCGPEGTAMAEYCFPATGPDGPNFETDGPGSSGTGSDEDFGGEFADETDQAGLASEALPKTGGAPMWLIPVGLLYIAFGSTLVWPAKQ